MTLILARLMLLRGDQFDVPCDRPFRLLRPLKFLLDNAGDVLVYNAGFAGLYADPASESQITHAILLNHGQFDGSMTSIWPNTVPRLSWTFGGSCPFSDNEEFMKLVQLRSS